MCKLALEKAEEPEIKLPTSFGSQRKQGNSRKKKICFIDYTNAFDYVDHNKLTLRPGLCKFSVRHHLIYSPVSQKLMLLALTSDIWNSSQSFLRCSSQVTILNFAWNKIFHFFLVSTDLFISFQQTMYSLAEGKKQIFFFP